MKTNLQWKLVRKKYTVKPRYIEVKVLRKNSRDIQKFKKFRLKYLKKKEFKLLNHFDNGI